MMDFRFSRRNCNGQEPSPEASRVFSGRKEPRKDRFLSPKGGVQPGNEAPAAVVKPDGVETYDISAAVFDEIIKGIASWEPERGGALGMDASGRIARFYLDDQGSRTAAAMYSPNAEKVTEIINAWGEEGITFCGMIHSHPGQFCQPSVGDYDYACRILAAMPQTLQGRFLMPILTIDFKRSMARIQGFAVYADKAGTRLTPAKLTVDGQPLPEQVSIGARFSKSAAAEAAVESAQPREAGLGNQPEPAAPSAAGTSEVPWIGEDAGAPYAAEEIFRRNASLLPLDELSRRTVVIVGCGGARAFCESLARSGVGRIVLMDGDTVSVTNAATQGTYLNEIGMAKTEVIARSLRQINPHMQIVECGRFLDDSVSDETMEELIGRDLLANSPERVLLCGCTDNFPAQDRTVKLALKWGVPYLAGQSYAEGLAGEVVFSYPGVTEACPRCMLASRYAAYEKAPEQTAAVTSEGAPIYVTDLLNAIKTHIAMMLLTYGTGCRIGEELKLVKDRNLVLFSNSPLSEERLGLRAFSREFAALGEEERRVLLLGGIVWLKQKPDRPENGFPHCPYCGGAGDLRILRGLNADTRKVFSLSKLISAALPGGAGGAEASAGSGEA